MLQSEKKDCEYVFLNKTLFFNSYVKKRKKKTKIKFADLCMDYSIALDFLKYVTWNGVISDDYVPQGICLIEDIILISAYCGGQGDSRYPSVIFVLDKTGNHLGIWKLNFYAHVGGLAYDGRNVWVCSGGKSITAFDYRYCMRLLEESGDKMDISIEKAKIKEIDTDTTTSFCTCYNNRLWSGKFVASPGYRGEPWIYGYKYRHELKTTEVLKGEKNEIYAVKKVQGISFLDYGNQKFIILSRSFGKNMPSYIEIYEYEQEEKYMIKKLAVVKIKVPPMLEQIMLENGKLYLLFESCAKKFFQKKRVVGNCRNPVNRLCVIDIAKIMEGGK